MRILRWSGSQPAGYRFDCPKWIRDGFETGTLYGYVCVNEEEACVASYLAFYLSDEAAEVIAYGVTQGYDPAVTLGRLYRRLRRHCREREIARIEEEIIGQISEDVEHILLREDFLVPEETVGMWKLPLEKDGMDEASCDRAAVRLVDKLSEAERESLIALMMTADEKDADAGYQGSPISELCAVYLHDGRAEACIFCSDYRGIVRADSIYAFPDCEDSLRALWAYIREETGRIRPDVNELYLPQTKEAACLAEGAEEVGVHVWMWMDSEMDAITFHDAELEADMALTDSMETGGLMLSRLTPFTRMLEAEGEEYDLSLDVHMLPQVMLRIYCLGTDYIMEIGCKLMDMERGEFRFTVRTELAGYEDAGKAALLCSRINENLERATAYWDESGRIVLRGHAVDDECADVIRWRKFLQDWTLDCHAAGVMFRTEDGDLAQERKPDVSASQQNASAWRE